MSNALEMFKGNSLVSSDLFKQLQGMNENLTGGGGFSARRISLKGSKFRQMVGGEQMGVKRESFLNVVIVDAAPLGRTYYEGEYSADNPTAPTCWSVDTKTPAETVPEDQRLAKRCMDCPKNIKGSGVGETRACKYSQRLAVVMEGKWDTVYQLQLPAMSVFGDAKGGHMPMQAYAKYLAANNAPAIAVVTQMYFDEDSDVPKLFFKPERPLSEDELIEVIKARDLPETKAAITMTVAQTDGVQGKEPAAAEAPKKAASKPRRNAIEDEDDQEEVAEPTRQKSKKAEAPDPEPDNLADIVDSWDD